MCSLIKNQTLYQDRLIIFSFKGAFLENSSIIFHSSVLTNTAEFMRNGGWLFWDTPSQYGFLNISLISFLPFKSAFNSLHFLQGVLPSISSQILYFSFSSTRKNILGKILAFNIALVFTFKVAGWFPTLAGVAGYPSVGLLRFIWAFILLYIVMIFTEDKIESNRKLFWFCVLGNLGWSLSIIWSAKSAIYAVVIWLSSFYCVLTNNFTFKNCYKVFLYIYRLLFQ